MVDVIAIYFFELMLLPIFLIEFGRYYANMPMDCQHINIVMADVIAIFGQMLLPNISLN